MRTMIHLVAVVSLAACTAAAQTVAERKARATPLSPQAYSNYLAETGGMVERPLAGRRIVLAAAGVPRGELESFAAGVRRLFRLPCAVGTIPAGSPQAMASAALADTNAAAAIIVYDGGDAPMLLVAPEARWAAVNLRGLSGEARLRKELWRAFGYVMGAANTPMPGCVLKPVFGPEGLDTLKGNSLSPTVFGGIFRQARALGIAQVRPATYRRACEEGWAPTPTNQFQKAIWEQVKAKK